MITVRLVQIANGKFAVQLDYGRLFKDWCFLEGNNHLSKPEWGRTWDINPIYVDEYCSNDTLEGAEVAFTKNVEFFKKNTKEQIKVIKVIKEVKI